MSGIAGNGCDVLVPFSDRKPLKEIEQSLTKTYRKHIWAKFIKAIKTYKLVEEGDKIAVAVSGGKDSLLMAKLFQQLKRTRQINFEVVYLLADPGYHEDIKKLMLDNCNYLDIPITVFNSGIFEIVDDIAKDYPCYLCAKMRRGALYSKAKELGCNKLALGHHFNDVIETTLLNVLYAGNFKIMLPKLKAANFENMELIRPMYYIEEEHIESFTQECGIWPLNCACMVAAKKIGNKRYQVKALIKELKKDTKDIDKSIFKAGENVNLDAILGWRNKGKQYSYLDFYDEE